MPRNQEIRKVNVRLGEWCWQHTDEEGSKHGLVTHKTSFQERQVCFWANSNGRKSLLHCVHKQPPNAFKA